MSGLFKVGNPIRFSAGKLSVDLVAVEGHRGSIDQNSHQLTQAKLLVLSSAFSMISKHLVDFFGNTVGPISNDIFLVLEAFFIIDPKTPTTSDKDGRKAWESFQQADQFLNKAPVSFAEAVMKKTAAESLSQAIGFLKKEVGDILGGTKNGLSKVSTLQTALLNLLIPFSPKTKVELAGVIRDIFPLLQTIKLYQLDDTIIEENQAVKINASELCLRMAMFLLIDTCLEITKYPSKIRITIREIRQDAQMIIEIPELAEYDNKREKIETALLAISQVLESENGKLQTHQQDSRMAFTVSLPLKT